jgi:hypothetical protein
MHEVEIVEVGPLDDYQGIGRSYRLKPPRWDSLRRNARRPLAGGVDGRIECPLSGDLTRARVRAATK